MSYVAAGRKRKGMGSFVVRSGRANGRSRGSIGMGNYMSVGAVNLTGQSFYIPPSTGGSTAPAPSAAPKPSYTSPTSSTPTAAPIAPVSAPKASTSVILQQSTLSQPKLASTSQLSTAAQTASAPSTSQTGAVAAVVLPSGQAVIGPTQGAASTPEQQAAAAAAAAQCPPGYIWTGQGCGQSLNPLAQLPTWVGGAPGSPCFGGSKSNPFAGITGETGFCYPLGTPAAAQAQKAAARGSSLSTSQGTNNSLGPKVDPDIQYVESKPAVSPLTIAAIAALGLKLLLL